MEIVATCTEQIAQLPTIHGVDVNRIRAFHAKLASYVHVLETMKLIGDIALLLKLKTSQTTQKPAKLAKNQPNHTTNQRKPKQNICFFYYSVKRGTSNQRECH